MSTIFMKLIQIYQSPFLVFAGRFEFANCYNLILLLVFIAATTWFARRAWFIVANTQQGLSTFDGVTRDNLVEKFGHISDQLQNSSLAEPWKGFENTFIVEQTVSPSGEDQKRIHTSSDASIFFNENRLIRINRGLFGALPGIFTGLGILGTFLGLIFGLHGLDFSNATLIRQSMEQILGGMLIAFSTSVWGLTLSICFTSMEKWTINELETRILQLQDTINSVFSVTTQEIYLNHLLEESRQQSKALKSFSTDLADAIKRGMGEAVNQEVASAINRLAEVTEKLSDFKHETATESIEKLIERFNAHLTGSAHAQFERLSQAVGDIADTVNDTSGALQVRVEQMNESSAQTVDAMLQQTQTWVQNLENRLNDVTNQRQVELNEILTVLREAQGVIAESNRSTQQMQAFTGSMENLVENLQQVTTGFGEIAGDIQQAHQTYSDTTEKLISNGEQQNTFTEEMLTQLQHMPQTMQSLWEAYDKKLAQTVGDIQKVFRSLKDGVLDYQTAVDQGLQGYIAVTRNSLGDYLGQVDTQLAKSAQVLGSAISSLSDGVDEMHEAISKMHTNGSHRPGITV